MPLSSVDSVSPAFQHAKEQLFRPFRLGQWTRLALVGLLAGELSSSGGCNFQAPHAHASSHDGFPAGPHIDPALLIPLVIAALIVVPILWLLILYISSHMRFILFDSVIEKNCSIRRMWSARREPSLKYFVWQLVLSLIVIAGAALIVGVPVLAAFTLGWITHWRDHLAGLILAGIVVFFAFLAWMLLSLLVHVLTKDFVVPMMALENVSAFEGWGKLLPMMKSERGRYAGYVGMKVILAISAAFFVGITALILVLLLLIPIGGLGVASVLLGHAAGLTWNVFTITFAVLAGLGVLLVLFYGVSLISVPVIVFFPAYSIYFFSARYPLLANLIYPPPPAPPLAPAPQPGG